MTIRRVKAENCATSSRITSMEMDQNDTETYDVDAGQYEKGSRRRTALGFALR